MPYTIAKNDKEEFCVHKKGEDGEPMGESLGCHKTKKEAVAQIGAIESEEKREGGKSFDVVEETITEPENTKDCGCDKKEKAIAIQELYAIKALGGGRIGGYAVLWGDEKSLDLHGEFFTPETKDLKTVFKAVGTLPFMVHHASDDEVKSFVAGAVDVLEDDEVGLWFEAKVKEFEAYHNYVKPLINKKMAFTSTGTFPAAKRNGDKGFIARWPIAEISATWTPAEYRMLNHPIDEIKSAYKSIGINDLDPSIFDGNEINKDVTEIDKDQTGVEKARLKAIAVQELLKLGLLELEMEKQ